MLGRKPRQSTLYSLAFRHKSASLYENGKKLNNERLEYLGDAVLGAVVADILFKKYPNQKEGFLTKLRSKIVSRKHLNEIGAAMQLEKYLLFKGTVADNVLGNCIEALIGAIYLDFGYEETKKIVIERFVEEYSDLDKLLSEDENFKSKLVEWAQHEKKELVFESAKEQKEGRPYFVSSALLDGEVAGKGEGSSKKKSQQIAAEMALRKVKLH